MGITPHKSNPPPISLGGIVYEELPLHFVHYPPHYGTFIAFSETIKSEPFLCDCAMPAIQNYFELMDKSKDSSSNYNYDTLSNYEQIRFPDGIFKIINSHKNEPLHGIRFKKALCHRCNLTPPSRRFCHEMYGVRFIQYYGWYVEQAKLRLGIFSIGGTYLENVILEEYMKDINNILKTASELAKAWEWFHEREEIVGRYIHDPDIPLPKSDFGEIARRQDILREAQRKNRRAERVLSKKIENIVREEFGFKKVGERWTSETMLFQIVSRLLSDQEILRHHRPDWLEGLEIDIFLPKLNMGIEYQGQQHFHAINAWGGEKALLDLQARDKRKKLLCEHSGVRLITVDYTDPLTIEFIRGKIRKTGY